MQNTILSFGILILAGVLTACGGGGGDDSSNDNAGSGGGENPTVELDAGELGTAAASLSSQLIAREGNSNNLAPTFGKQGSETSSLQSQFDDLVGLTLSEITVEDGICGGSITSDYTITTDDETVFPFEVESETVFDNYCLPIDANGNIFYNGSIYVEMDFPSENQGSSYWRFDLSYTSNHPAVIPSSGSWFEEVSCTFTDGINYSFDDEDCTETLIFSDSNDEEYRTEDVVVSGDNQNGYDVDFEFIDEDGTAFSASFTDLTVCQNGNIGSGSGAIVINEDELVIDFISCSEFTVTYNGETTALNQ